MSMTREQAWDLLTQYNQEEFHLRHAVTVEHVMRWFARELGYGDREEFWGIVGLLHDLDFERWPEEHCKKSQELMRQAGVEEEIVRATASHGWGHCVDIKPEQEMEKVLFAVDELTGPDAPLQKRVRHGAQVPEEEIQGQEIRRRLLPGRDRPGGGAAGLGAGPAAGPHSGSHAGGGGGH